MPEPEPPHFSRLAEELIGDLRGVATVEPRRQVRRPAQHLHEVVETLLNRYHIGRESREQVIRDQWPKLVGPSVARYTHAAHIDEQGRLVVLTSNSIVRSELQQHRHLVAERIRELPGCGGVKALLLRAG